MWRETKQLTKEFWLPAVIAVLWTSWVLGTCGKLVEYISHFASAFFLSSWATGQFNRVRRAHEVKDSFALLAEHAKRLDVSMTTLLRWMSSLEDQIPPRSSPPSVATPTAIENLVVRGTSPKREMTDGERKVVDLALRIAPKNRVHEYEHEVEVPDFRLAA